jgi:kynurenine 3-monooxygenase
MSMSKQKITIVGAGMSGPLMAIYLARWGYQVELYERRGDMRREPIEAGKSIKLTLAERGLNALAKIGLSEEVKSSCCIPLSGRAVHSGNGSVAFIPYGKNDREVIYSFTRTDLNALLLDRAEGLPSIKLFFHRRCVSIDKESAAAVFLNERTGESNCIEADVLIGADGAFSSVRQQMQRGERADYRQEFLPWGYKELSIVPSPDGLHQMERHALHIWPCGDHMLFALPNLNGSFNAVCVLPFQGENSFGSIRGDADVRTLFTTYFGDALPLMPRLCEEFASRRVSEFLTIRTSRWHHRGKVVLIGDSCHAVVPFYGQGMNAAFEDCSTLDRCIAAHPGDWETIFVDYQDQRKSNTDVLATLSVENFHELRDTVRRPIVAARKQTAIFVNRLFSKAALPLYTMVSHTNIPYSECVERARQQDRIARLLGLDLVVGAVSLWVSARNLWARRRAARQSAVRQLSDGGALALSESSAEEETVQATSRARFPSTAAAMGLSCAFRRVGLLDLPRSPLPHSDAAWWSMNRSPSEEPERLEIEG